MLIVAYQKPQLDSVKPQITAVDRAIFLGGLCIILIAGALLRFSHANWDGINHLHPDERAILFVAQTIQMPDAVGDFFSPARSPLNPLRTAGGDSHSYPYGHLPLYALVLAQRLLTFPCSTASPFCDAILPDSFLGHLLNVSGQPRFTHLTYTGRALSALYDTLTILATGLLAYRLFNHWAGLLAAAFSATAVLHIQNAHFGTVDTALTLFTTLTMWFLARYAATTQRRDTLVAGALAGLAMGCKATAALLILPITAAHIAPKKDSSFLRWRRVNITALRLNNPSDFGLSLLALTLTFILSNPYAVLDPVLFLTEIGTQVRMVSGALDWPFTRQYIGTLPLWYTIQQQALWTLGLPLTLAAYAGLVWATRHALKTRSRPVAVVLVWVGVMLLTTGFQQVKFVRYTLPLVPALFSLAGGMFSQKTGTILTPILASLVLLPTALYTLAFTAMYGQPHPWIAASEWIYRSIPQGTVIPAEKWDDPLPLDIVVDGVGYTHEAVFSTCMLDPFAEPDDTDKLLSLLDCVARSDYIILSSNRAYGAIPRLVDRYPLTAAYYRALFASELGFGLERTFSRHPTFMGLGLCDNPFSRPGLENPLENQSSTPPPRLVIGPADESFTVYDHPLVLIFRNKDRLSVTELRSIILSQVENQ